MESTIHVTKNDLVEFRLFNQLRCRNARRRRLAWALVPPIAIVVALFAVVALFRTGPIKLSITLLPLLGIVPIYFGLFQRVSRSRLKSELDQPDQAVHTKSLLGDYLIALSPDGLAVTRGSESTFRPWTKIPNVVADRSYGYIYTDQDSAIIIPQRCFSTDEAFCLFVKEAVIFHWNAEPGETPVVEEAVARVNESPLEPSFIPARFNAEGITLRLKAG